MDQTEVPNIDHHHQPEQCDSYLDLMSLGGGCGGYGGLALPLSLYSFYFYFFL